MSFCIHCFDRGEKMDPKTKAINWMLILIACPVVIAIAVTLLMLMDLGAR